MKKLAENKTAKLGEPLTSKIAGNPEASPKVRKARETRRRKCKRCKNDIPKTKYKSAIYCSKRCLSAYCAYKWRVSHGLIQKPGAGTGHNQGFGINHHSYRKGTGIFQRIAYAHHEKKCSSCGSKKFLCVHHIDHDPTNNVIENMIILCKRCHQEHHCKRDSKGRYTKV
jgi:hypothetical protein